MCNTTNKPITKTNKEHSAIRIFLMYLWRSIAAGVMIALAGYVYLNCENKYVGALLFSIGLITICYYSLNLYTSIVGYICNQSNLTKFLGRLLVAIIGNAIGCFIVAGMPISDVAINSLQIINNKTDVFSAFTNSFLCGMMIFIAVDIYKTKHSIIGILFCIPCFILSGMEHSVANMYYFFLAPSIKHLLFIGIYIIGNGIGSIFANVVLTAHTRLVNKR